MIKALASSPDSLSWTSILTQRTPLQELFSVKLPEIQLSGQFNGTFIKNNSLILQHRKHITRYSMTLSSINNNPSLVSATGSGSLSPSKQYGTGSLALIEEGNATHNACLGGKPLHHRLCTGESAIDEDFVDFAAGSSQSYNEINEAISISRAMYRVFLQNKKSITDDNIYDICECIQAHKDKDYLKNKILPSFSNVGGYADPKNLPEMVWADHVSDGAKTTYIFIPGSKRSLEKLKIAVKNFKESLETWGLHKNSANKIPRIHAGIKRAVDRQTKVGKPFNKVLKKFAIESLSDDRKLKILAHSFAGGFTDAFLTKLYSPNGLPGFTPAETDALKKNLDIVTTGGVSVGNQAHAEWFKSQVIKDNKDEEGKIIATNYMRITSDYDSVAKRLRPRNPLKNFFGPRAFKIEKGYKVDHGDFFKFFQRINRRQLDSSRPKTLALGGHSLQRFKVPEIYPKIAYDSATAPESP